MEISFNDKVALVTGAGSGLGLATAIAFAKAGAAVVLSDVNETAINTAAEKLRVEGYNAISIKCDVSKETEVEAMIAYTIATLGGLDVAYNNAGIQVPIAETADALGEDFDKAIAVNLRGVFNCLKYELRHMRTQGSGAIVNCSSQGGLVGTANLGAYTAAKHGVLGLTKSSALEYASRGIRINAICPGVIETPMVSKAINDAPEHMDAIIKSIPIARVGKEEEIASTVLWLCSPAAGFMVGQAVAPDGGFTIM